MKISVIIPVYNTEEYLQQCVRSVLSQIYTDIEIILVDDGSTDTSGTICDNFAEKDSRVIVIHKVNGGLSDARNIGIEAATGEYGIMIDSDDYWSSDNVVSTLVERARLTHADVISFAYDKYEEVTRKRYHMLSNANDMSLSCNEEIQQLQYLTSHSLLISSACNKMISMSVLKDTLFRRGLVSEDVEWCSRLILTAHSFDFIHNSFYCYRQRESSIAHSINEKSCKDLCYAVRKCCSLLKRMPYEKRRYAARYAAYQMSTFIAVQAFTPSFQKKTIQQLRDYSKILYYHGGNRKVIIMYYGTRIFGFLNWCRIIRATKNLWDSRREWV